MIVPTGFGGTGRDFCSVILYVVFCGSLLVRDICFVECDIWSFVRMVFELMRMSVCNNIVNSLFALSCGYVNSALYKIYEIC